ncbi:phosphopantetheine-binding protein [Paraburkholderia bonniea]|uniref:phosphopantetheine-binding protein n=1 Tax=Paraburkholderia bonniea TaxID=2152891 RepID=UPI0012928CC4|nr:phosphopantetheine-binding protein [Paraburkholderia bonniea]WJF91521.1 phosphopantetheine-binding protein [Paraburkholderia bonniea]WJF94840.1 phosphopantetheine-binding protein [Paraburkholderia bonniea]
MKQQIKNIVAQILYLDDSAAIADDASLFLDLNMSSIDYVDLCFELKEHLRDSITLDNLWPFNRMLLDPQLYAEAAWTAQGWQEVCRVMGWREEEAQKEQKALLTDMNALYAHFCVNYIARRIEQLEHA